MKILNIAIAAAFAVASTSATASVVDTQAKGKTPNTSHCHYEGSVIMPDGIYDVYYCHHVGDGWY